MTTKPATECSLAFCHEPRMNGSIFCGSLGNGHLAEYRMGYIRQLPDGQFVGAAGPEPFVPEWRRRLVAKDLTRGLA